MLLDKNILACPVSQQPLESISDFEMCTPASQFCYKCVDGIWRFTPPDRLEHFKQFIKEYETVRKAEGRGKTDKQYYRSLPYDDISMNFVDDWRIRAASLNALLKYVIEPLEQITSPLTALDVGAGNGWLSNRLAKRGHALGAVDLVVNDWDGLGAHKHYDVDFTPMQAEFDHLPVKDGQISLLVYNASFHYSEDYDATLTEGLRCLKAGGVVVVMDTPIYREAKSGQQMVGERQAAYQQEYGFASNVLQSEDYLTYDRINMLGEKMGIKWRRVTPEFSWGWRLRPLKARVLMRREPAKFALLIGRKS